MPDTHATPERGARRRAAEPFAIQDAVVLEAEFERALERARDAVSSFTTSRPSFVSLALLDRAEAELARAAMILEHFDETMGAADVQAAYTRVQARHAAFASAVARSPVVLRALGVIASGDEAAALDPARTRYLQRRIATLQQGGAALDADDRTRLAELDARLVELTRSFTQAIDDELAAFSIVVDAEVLAGVPASVLEATAQDAVAHGVVGHRLTLQAHCYRAVMMHAEDRELRRTMMVARNGLGVGNLGTLREILALRAERAHLLGHGTFADLVTTSRYAGSRAAANRFVDGLRARLRPAFVAEHAALLAFAAEHGHAQVQAWDVPWLAERQRRSVGALDPEALRDYFPLDRVLAGFAAIVHAWWGLEVRSTEQAVVWHADVRVLDVFAEGVHVGRIYLDLFDRDGKRAGAWMSPVCDRLDGSDAVAVAVAACDLTPPHGGDARLLHREVVRLFHELGHACHQLLSRVPMHGQSGTRVAWDIVEVPALLFEALAWEPEVLASISGHVDDGRPLPDHLLAQLVADRRHREISTTMWQLGIAAVDLAVHGTRGGAPACDGLEILQLAHAALDRAWPVPPPGGAAMIAGFTHLFGSTQGYEGSYYAYVLADVLAAQIVAALRPLGLLSRAAGSKLRDEWLARGDAVDFAEILHDLVGGALDPSALLDRLGVGEVRA